MADAALQRKNMVESQVRPNDVTDRRITAAMASIPRERFLPPQIASFAYSDENLTVAPGCTVLAPRVLAKLLQLAEIDSGSSVLVAGDWCGYAAAVAAQLSGRVVALNSSEAATAAARAALEEPGESNTVSAVTGPLADGWPAAAPYDVIVIEGGVEGIPDGLKAQLAEGGRLAAITAGTGSSFGRAFLLMKQGGEIERREAFQAAAPILKGFEVAKPAFIF